MTERGASLRTNAWTLAIVSFDSIVYGESIMTAREDYG